MTSLTMIDLFAGAGGLSRGLESAGFRSLYANEWIQQYADTYRANHSSTLVESADIRVVDAEGLRKTLGLQKGELSLVAGGPPCQGFSINAPKRSTDDYRVHLFREYLRFVDAFEPARLLIENVPGLVSFEGGATLDSILESLSELGYDADVQILYAPHFGVPQTRWRTVILGARRGQADPLSLFPSPKHHAPARVNFTSSHRQRSLVFLTRPDALEQHVTVEAALADLPPLSSGDGIVDGAPYPTPPLTFYQERMRLGSTGVYNHRAAKLSAINLERLRHIPAGGNWTDIPEALLPAGMRRARRSDHTKRYGRPRPTDLSSTILTKCDPHWGAYFHYSQERTLTVREAARIQSFPDSYVFTGSQSDQYAQVGNAVPPLLAEAIGQQLRASLEAEQVVRPLAAAS